MWASAGCGGLYTRPHRPYADAQCPADCAAAVTVAAAASAAQRPALQTLPSQQRDGLLTVGLAIGLATDAADASAAEVAATDGSDFTPRGVTGGGVGTAFAPPPLPPPAPLLAASDVVRGGGGGGTAGFTPVDDVRCGGCGTGRGDAIAAAAAAAAVSAAVVVLVGGAGTTAADCVRGSGGIGLAVAAATAAAGAATVGCVGRVTGASTVGDDARTGLLFFGGSGFGSPSCEPATS